MNNKTLILTLIASLFAFAQMAEADYVIHSTGGTGPSGYYVGPYGYSDGGEFTFTTGTAPGPTLDTSLYAGTTSNVVSTSTYGSTFQTFCLENAVIYNPGQSYFAVLTNISRDDHGTALNNGIAWLYSQFATGQLSGYDYSNTLGRNNSAGVVQQEIWHLMGLSSTYDTTLNNLVTTQLGLQGLNVYGTADSRFNVKILNLYADPNHTQIAQDQLVLTPQDHGNGSGSPTPIPAAAWLLGSGLMGLFGLRSKKKV